MRTRVQTACAVMRGGPERDLVISALSALGLSVSAAEEPYEALGQFMVNRPDLVVLSLAGLTLNDSAFLQQLRRLAPSMRVLVLVPEGRREHAVAFLEAGADAILTQTYLVAEFRLVVTALLRTEAADPLTGLPNRPAFEQALPREIARATRLGESLAVAIIDLDGFGEINANLGYAAANELLVDVSARLSRVFRSYDLLSRWGGDEYAAFIGTLPEDEEQARKQASEAFARTRTCLRDGPVFRLKGKNKKVRLSCGFALLPHHVPPPERSADERLTAGDCERAGRDLFDRANDALKLVKESGGDGVQCYTAFK
jgi:diguanylate cyclase (GGDEF)-like protein